MPLLSFYLTDKIIDITSGPSSENQNLSVFTTILCHCLKETSLHLFPRLKIPPEFFSSITFCFVYGTLLHLLSPVFFFLSWDHFHAVYHSAENSQDKTKNLDFFHTFSLSLLLPVFLISLCSILLKEEFINFKLFTQT